MCRAPSESRGGDSGKQDIVGDRPIGEATPEEVQKIVEDTIRVVLENFDEFKTPEKYAM